MTSTATVTTADRGVIIDSTNNTFAGNLPAAATVGSGFSVGFYVSGGGTFTITANGAETIQTKGGSANTLAMTTGQGALLQSTGTGWEVIASHGFLLGTISVYDNAFIILDNVDPTKTLMFNVGSAATTVDTILSVGAQTLDSTISLPVVNGNDTLLAENTVQTVTALKSFRDNALAIVGSSDATKTLVFDIDGVNAGVDLILYMGAQTADRIILFPVLSGNDTVVMESTAAVITGLKTYWDTAFKIVDDGDTSKTLVFSVGSQSAGVDVIFNTGAQTLDVTASLPVLAANDTFAMQGVANVFTKKNSFGDGVAVTADCTTQFGPNAAGQTGATQSTVTINGSNIGACTTARGMTFVQGTDNSTQTITSQVASYFGLNTKGANDTVTRTCGMFVRLQTVAANFNVSYYVGSTSALGAITGTYAWYNNTTGDEYHGTGTNQFAATTDASSLTTGAGTTLGGWSIAKTLIAGKGLGLGVTSTATAAGTTVLAQASAVIQIFTGTSTQTVTLPAANLWGAGVAVTYIIKNRSTLAVTINRAGSDTIDGGTSYVLAGNVNASVMLASDGVSEWEAL